MPRRLAIACALATVLAVAGCGASEPMAATDGGGASPAQPAEQSAEQSGEATPGLESDSSGAEAFSSTDAAMQRDPGVPGLPAGSGASVDDVLRLGAVATWIERPTLIGLSLPSGSDCAAFAAEPVAESPTTISVTFAAPETCEDPTAARTYAIEVPEGIDTSGEVVVSVDGLPHAFTLTLPAE